MSGDKQLFKYIIGFSALFVAFNAAFFSIFGLSKLFAGASLSVIVMASSLELGKLVGASFLYRYWKDISFLMKTYMTIGVVVLIGITSGGIFGFLSNAYQGATITFEKETTLLSFKEDRLEQLKEDKVFLKEELEISVNSLPDNYITAKRKLREEYNPQIQALSVEILNVKSEISDLEVSLVETGVDVGPAIYLAKVFDTDVDSVVKFFIFILIFVFDPMAVALVIATNVVLVGGKVRSKNKDGPTENHFFDLKVIEDDVTDEEKVQTWTHHGEDGSEVKVKNKPEDKEVLPGGVRPSSNK